MDKEITNRMLDQDERSLSLIQLLQRARDRETLNDETARKLDEIEKRVENGQPVPQEEFELFFKAVSDSNEATDGRFSVLREKIEAYNKEQLSIQDERISAAEERTTLSRLEEDLTKQMEWAVQSGDTKEMEAVQQRMDILQQRKDNLQKPQDLEHKPQISEEERDEVYDQLNQYSEQLEKEIDENTNDVSHFSIEDITKKVENVRESNYKKRFDSIKRDRQVIKEQDMGRDE